MVAMPAVERRGIPLDPVAFGPQILEQLVIGSALAFGVAAVFAAVEMAGSLVDLSIGFSLAQVINPTLNTSVDRARPGLLAGGDDGLPRDRRPTRC